MIKFILVAMVMTGPQAGVFYTFPEHQFDSLAKCKIAAYYAQKEAKGLGKFECAQIITT